MRRMPASKLVLLAVSAALGCDGGGGAPTLSTTTAKATVSGTVTVKGKPVKKGTINFNPANAQRKDVAPVDATIGSDGKYKVETLAGTNRVRVVTSEGGAAAGSGYSKIFEAKEGENTHDIDIAIGAP